MPKPVQGLADRTPPHDKEAERAVNGSMLKDNRIIPEVMRVLPPESADRLFYCQAHALIYTHITRLFKQIGRADTVLLGSAIGEAGHAKEIGGYGFVTDLYDGAPSAANGVYYAEIVRRKAEQRSYLMLATDIAREAENPSNPAGLTDRIQTMVLNTAQLSQRVEMSKLTKECAEILEDVDNPNPAPPGFACGLPPLDLVFRTEPGTVTTIGAATSVGKSILLGQMAFGLASQSLPVLLVSLEMRRKEIAQRLMALAGEVRFNAIRGNSEPTAGERTKLSDAYTTLSSIPLFVRSDHMSIGAIETEARYAKMKHGLKVLAVDYLQLIDASRVNGETRTEVVGKISRGLKRIALELDVAVLTASQFNRDTGEVPTLANLRESGSIEQDSDAVILIWDELGDHAKTKINGRVAKQRNGERADFVLARDANYMRFKTFLG